MKNVILIVCISVLLAACDGRASDPKIPTTITPANPNTANNSEDNTKIGVFIDAPVKGLAYTSAPSGKKGTTNEKGEFEYIDGDTVSFNMGAIELGSATPDKTNMVKVTQLGQALLIAQLLQALDDDVNEDRIDVSDVVIPEVVKQSIIDRLQDKDGDANTADIITEEQLVSIKKVNPKKLTLQQRIKVVSKEKALAHIKQQIGKSDLRFSASELKNLFLIDVSLLKKFEGDNLAFSASNSIKQINVKKNHAEMSDASWELDAKGNLAISFKRDNCTLSKLNEDVDSIDISWSCTDKGKPKNIRKGLKYFVKPQPFSANDLSGKSFNFTSLNKERKTLTFRNNGTYDCGDEGNCTYKDSDHKNAVRVHVGDDDPHEGALMILAQGSLAKGKFLIIHYNGENKLDYIEVIKVSGNTLKQVFASADNDESSDHNNNTDDNSDSNNNPNAGISNPTYSPFTQDMISGKTLYNVYTDWEDQDKDGSTTDWVASTFTFDNSGEGRGMFGLRNSSTAPDATFNYSIDDKGYLILSNVTFMDPNDDPGDGHNMDAIGIIEDAGDSFKVCWRGSPEQFDNGNGCDGNERFYKIKADAEAALEAPEIVYSSDYSDREDDSYAIQNPTYIPFTQEMLENKTLYGVYPGNYGPKTFIFDSTTGHTKDGLHDSIALPDMTFDWRIDSNGYLIFSNVIVAGASDQGFAMGLVEETDDYFKVCGGDSTNDITSDCVEYGEDVDFYYKTKDAAEDNAQPTADANGLGYAMPEGFTQPPKDAAVTDAIVDYYNPSTEETWQSSTGGYGLAPGWIRGTKEDYETNKEYYDSLIAGVGNIAYTPFTKDMISGKTLYNVYTDWDDQDKDGSTTDWVASTLTFDNSGEGKGGFGIHDSITKADVSFNYSINDKGYLILSNVTFINPEYDPDDGHNTDAIGLIASTGDSFKICWRGSPEQLDNGNGCDGNERFYKTKADAEAALENQ